MRDRRRERDVTSWPGGTLEADVPAGVDRRAFLMRSAVVGAAAVLTGWNAPAEKEAAAPAAAPLPRSRRSRRIWTSSRRPGARS